MPVRPLASADRKAWEPLWRAYQVFYKVSLSDVVTQAAWRRIIDSASAVEGFAAFDAAGQMLGFAHTIRHAETWSVNDRVYLKDLFTVPEARGKGIGRALIAHASARAKEQGSDRLWWLTHETNETGRALYDRVAEKTGFIQYRITL